MKYKGARKAETVEQREQQQGIVPEEFLTPEFITFLRGDQSRILLDWMQQQVDAWENVQDKATSVGDSNAAAVAYGSKRMAAAISHVIEEARKKAKTPV